MFSLRFLKRHIAILGFSHTETLPLSCVVYLFKSTFLMQLTKHENFENYAVCIRMTV